MRDLTGFLVYKNKVLVSSLGSTMDNYISQDFGATWSYIPSDSTPGIYGSNLIHGNNIFMASRRLMKSKDSGSSWRTAFTPKKFIDFVRKPATNGKFIIAGVNNEGVIMSKDSGSHWRYINEGLGEISKDYGVAFNSDYAYCASAKGQVYRISLTELSPVKEKEPAREILDVKVYPNPLKNFATVEFGRPLRNGSLKLYNMRGQEVMKIERINEKNIALLRENLTAGTYIYIVSEAGQQLASGKLQME